MFPISSEKLAELIGGKLTGKKGIILNGLNRIETAGEGEATFLYNPKYEKHLSDSNASCVIIYEQVNSAPKENQAFILLKDPYTAVVKLMNILEQKQKDDFRGFIHENTNIDKSSNIADSAYIDFGCSIGKNCIIGENVIIYANVVIYDDCKINENTIIHANSTIYSRTEIGRNCIIHSGVVLGADGFGFIENNDGSYQKIPQLGNVVIGDNVEIGANSTVDRAMLGSTLIENGVKIDNLVQIGHNSTIGENTAIVSQAGISGSVKVGKRCRIAGQVGIAGHNEIVDDVTLIAQSGVPKSITKKGTYFGTPARERLQAFRIEACINQLPQLVAELRELKAKAEKS